jgi:integrase
LCKLRWRDVDLAAGWLTVGESKTDAGRRYVKIRGALRDELTAVRAHVKGTADGYVFPTREGGLTKADNFRNRVLARAVERANERLAAEDLTPLPPKLTPHSMRRTFALVLYALGEDHGVVMDEMGHTDPGLALRVYRQSMRRDENEKAALRRLVEGSVLPANGSTSENGGACDPDREPDRAAQTPIQSGVKGP